MIGTQTEGDEQQHLPRRRSDGISAGGTDCVRFDVDLSLPDYR
jgi:hypothetical protein